MRNRMDFLAKVAVALLAMLLIAAAAQSQYTPAPPNIDKVVPYDFVLMNAVADIPDWFFLRLPGAGATWRFPAITGFTPTTNRWPALYLNLEMLVTQTLNGGAGFATPIFVDVTLIAPTGAIVADAQDLPVSLANPLGLAALSDRGFSGGVGYETYGAVALPPAIAEPYLAGGLTLDVTYLWSRLPNAYHVAVNQDSVELLVAPRRMPTLPAPLGMRQILQSGYATIDAPTIDGWDWLRTPRAWASWTFRPPAGTAPGSELYLAMNTLVTQTYNGGGGFGNPITLTVTVRRPGFPPIAVAVQLSLMNPLQAAGLSDPAFSRGVGYKAYSCMVLPEIVAATFGPGAVMTVSYKWSDFPYGHHVAVNPESVRILYQ